jgi:hypothetical protein
MADKNQPPLYSETQALDRPGVFVNLNGFVQCRDSSPRTILNLDEYKPLTTANPALGDIIHILEDNYAGPYPTCLHQRVMLVIRHDEPSKNTVRTLTCVPLCYHTGVGKETTHYHWNVEQERRDGAKVQAKAAVSNIAVRDSRHPHALAIRFINSNHVLPAGITVNLAETWPVPYEGIKVRDLGKVPSKNLTLARTQIAQLFYDSVMPKPVAEKEPDTDCKKEKEPAGKK